MNALADSPGLWGVLIVGLVVLYILPSLIGAVRRVEGLGWLIVVNLIPTGVGWLAAIVLACMLPRRDPRTAYPVEYRVSLGAVASYTSQAAGLSATRSMFTYFNRRLADISQLQAIDH